MQAKKSIRATYSAAFQLGCFCLPTLLLAEEPNAPMFIPPSAEMVDTSNLLVPNSEEIIHDVQSAMASSKHQRGTVGEWQYILYPDGTAIVRKTSESRQAGIVVSCELNVSCDISQQGQSSISVLATGGDAPVLPDDVDGNSLARFISETVLAGTGKAVSAKTKLGSETNEADLAEPIETVATNSVATPTKASPTEFKIIPESPERPLQATTPPSPKIPKQVRQSKVRRPAHKRVEVRTSKPPRPEPTPNPVAQSEWAQSQNIEPAKPKLAFAKKYKLACTVSATTGLGAIDQSNDSNRVGKPRASLACFMQLSPKLSGRVSLVRYLNPSQQEDWDPDFTYAFNYKATEKLTFSYSNYTARFDGDGHSFMESLTSGALRASYKIPKIQLPFDKVANCTASINLPDPTSKSVRLFCGMNVTDKLFVAGTAHAYFDDAQESYQPDFTYTATYKFSNRWNLTYSNYGNNRFPWNKAEEAGKGILGGSLTLSHKIKF